jgi:hypothetical protein
MPIPVAPTSFRTTRWSNVRNAAETDGLASSSALAAICNSSFCLWPLQGLHFSVDESPVKTDVVADFVAACKAEGTIFWK